MYGIKKIFISIPMHGREAVDVSRDISIVKDAIRKDIPEIEFVDALDTPELDDTNHYYSPRLYYLGNALIKMAECDAVVFCKGWQYARGCRVEHEAAKMYGLDMLYQGDF